MTSSLSLNGHISFHFYTIHLKLSTHAYFPVLFHSMWSKYENSKNTFYDIITSVLYCRYGILPLKVSPNPFESHFFLHKTYSEKPPGPAHMSAKYRSSCGETTLWPLSSFGLVNMKSNEASSSAIFIAALFWKMPPLIVSWGLDLVLAFKNSSSPRLSKTVCEVDKRRNYMRMQNQSQSVYISVCMFI